MHKRPRHKHHGGLWEFPGGKVDSGEVPVIALIRELSEELGIRVNLQDCIPTCFAQEGIHDREKPIVILLYTLTNWEGEPKSLEGGKVGWFTPSEVLSLDKLPLDIELAQALFTLHNL